MKTFIFMADVLDSRKHAPAQLAQQLRLLVEQAQIQFSHAIRSPLTITLGDEFQGVINTLPDALHLMVWFEEKRIQQALPFKLRMLVHQGEIETTINSNIAYGMLGQGLTDAREHLQSMKKSNHRFWVSGLIDKPEKEGVLNHTLSIYQNLVESWTPTEAQFAASFMKNDDYKWVALQSGKSPSTTWRRRKNLNMDSYFSSKYLLNTLPSCTFKPHV